MCGLVTGGSDECWWTCKIQRVENPVIPGGSYPFIPDPSCLAECYPADHCLSLLLADYHNAGGICRGSWLDVTFPGLFPVSNKSCELYETDYPDSETDLKTGLCSESTKKSFSSDQQGCIHPLWNQKVSIFQTADKLIRSLCDWQTWWDFIPAPIEGRRTRKSTIQNRLTPIDFVGEINGVTIARAPPLQHTKHRYPFICSMRRIGQQSSHMCGVTLLSRPPGPTVLVTSAHCAFICKSEDGKLVPNCCCPNVGPGLCTESQDCGTNATTVEITGAEAEVICGEWDTATDTEEEYNVILPIKKIIIHPEFNISRGEENSQFVASDISVIQVDDRNFEAQSSTHKIYPACLPSNNPLTTTTAIHSGWSKPPPKDYITSTAPHYEEFYGEFFKQWHHAMDLRKCGDPQTLFWTGASLKHPTNSFYPPGTVCATEVLGEFCPTSGESGSPLMVRDEQGRMAAEGINSFIKARV